MQVKVRSQDECPRSPQNSGPTAAGRNSQTLSSDAYATGQALVALHQAGNVPDASIAYRNGIKFLLKTQFKDGSWLVISRARGTQPYFESGFPHGTNQFISAAGTAWATSALSPVLEGKTVTQHR